MTWLNIITAIALAVGAVLALRAGDAASMRASVAVLELRFPSGQDEAGVHAFLGAVSGLLPPWWRRWWHTPFMAVEVHADQNGTRHRLLVPEVLRRNIEAALAAHLPGVATSEIEDELVGFWQRSIAMPANLAEAIRTHVEKQVAEERDDIDRQMRKHRRAMATISSAQERLLDAYLSGTITNQQFSERQEKHAKQMAAAERALQANRVHWNDVDRTFSDVLELAQHAGAAYSRATGEVRRQLNRAFFTRLIVDAETIQGAEVTDTFAAIVTEDVIRRATTPRDEANPAAEPWEGYDVRGSNTFRLVHPVGFEPTTPCSEDKCSNPLSYGCLIARIITDKLLYRL